MDIQISGYKITQKLYESKRSLIFRAADLDTQAAVVIKAIHAPTPEPERVYQFQFEYQVNTLLQGLSGINAAFELKAVGHSFAMLMPDFGGTSLKLLYPDTAMPLDAFLGVAVQLAKASGAMHGRGIIHRDINPRNMIWNPERQELRLIDFGIASQLQFEDKGVVNRHALQGSLPYLSPEQTGRMNRMLDYRSDYYGMGASFYELLTGRPPFKAETFMDWIHAHLAKPVVDPREFNPQIPDMLAAIVKKLLAKNAEDRYQSSFGLVADLEYCAAQWQQKKSIISIPVAQNDLAERLQYSQKLFGREHEKSLILSAYEQDVAQGGSQLVLIHGPSGVGKSALIAEMEKEIFIKQGHFTKGKFDQFRQDKPYSAIREALQGLAQQILSLGQEELDAWRHHLLSVVGRNGRVITELASQFAKIIGPGEELAALNHKDAQNRFSHTLRAFIGALARQDHPLVLFLDDLQWADASSLELIGNLLTTHSSPYLLLLGAYRDNELGEGHPLTGLLEELAKSRPPKSLALHALSQEAVTDYLADTFRCSTAKAEGLAALVHAKTRGNPFFVNQLLRKLADDELISFDRAQGSWQWALERIKQLPVADNVVAFLLPQLQRLEGKTQQVLQLAACLGSPVSLQTLAVICEQSRVATAVALWPAIELGFMVPLNDEYRLLARLPAAGEEPAFLKQLHYQFVHDRVQEAAYALTPDERKRPVHLQIARLLQRSLTPSELAEHALELAHHYNIGRMLISDAGERLELARLNLMAGQKAAASAAYRSAFDYFSVGRELLPGDAWQAHYALALNLSRERATYAYLCRESAQAEAAIAHLLSKVKSAGEKAAIYRMQLTQHTSDGKMVEAIALGSQALSLLGVKLPVRPHLGQVAAELIAVKIRSRGLVIAELVNRPRLATPDDEVCLKIIVDLLPAALLTGNENLMVYLVLKAVNFCLQKGHGAGASYAYSFYGTLLGAGFADFAAGYKFGEMAIALNEALGDQEYRAKTYFTHAMFIMVWNVHWRHLRPYFRKALESGIQSGDLLYTTFIYDHMIPYDPLLDLPAAISKGAEYIQRIEENKYQDVLDVAWINQQLRLNLCGKTPGVLALSEPHDEAERLSRMARNSFSWGSLVYHLYKMELYFLYDKPERAGEHYAIAERCKNSVMGAPESVEFCFFSALTLMASLPKVGWRLKAKYLAHLAKYFFQMRTWAKHCPENFLHLHLMMRAEWASLRRKSLQAMNLYGQAIKAARRSEYIRYEALAHELAARHFKSLGQSRAAAACAEDAIYCYKRWGATGKAEHLRNQFFPQVSASTPLSLQRAEATQAEGDLASSSVTISHTGLLDVDTIVAASQTISREVVFDEMMQKLMEIMLKNSGADKAVLFLQGQGQQALVAAAEAKADAVTALAADAYVEVGRSVVDYAERTGEVIVLREAHLDPRFQGDPYLQQRQPQSLLCLPLIHQGQGKGVLYLENKLTADVFTHERIKVLGLLSAQAAISIENASLYRNLEDKVVERTRELEAAQSKIIEISKWKALGEMANGLAHEINNPLAIIEGLAAQLALLAEQHAADQGRAAKLAGKITTTVMRIAGIVSQFKLFANKDVQASLEECTLDELIASTLTFCRERLSAAGVRVELEGPTQGLAVLCERSRFIELLTILINNARDAVAESSDKWIVVRAYAVGAELCLEVRDSGPGVPAAIVSKLFQPFISGKELGQGMGLGLSTAKNIVEALGGQISYERPPGGPTQFRVRLKQAAAPGLGSRVA